MLMRLSVDDEKRLRALAGDRLEGPEGFGFCTAFSCEQLASLPFSQLIRSL